MTNVKLDVDVKFLPQEIAGDPEVAAMLGAFWSRSPMPIEQRVAELGSDYDSVKKKLENVVIGYGHASVLDMANVSIFIERIPILAAASIENHALFAGQETSTRYVDWSVAPFVNPFEGEIYEVVEEAHSFLRTVYVNVAKGVYNRIVDFNKASVDLEGDSMTRAIKARSFDVARGFLPCSATTNVCWSGRLSSILEHLKCLAIHPDPYIVQLAYLIHKELSARYSFVVQELIPETEENTDFYWQIGDLRRSLFTGLPPSSHYPFLRIEEDESYRLDFLPARKRKERVPPSVANKFKITIRDLIDYGSLRDLNRHRVGFRPLPWPLSVTMHPWYMTMAKEFLPTNFDTCIQDFTGRMAKLVSNKRLSTAMAYLIPLGSLVDVYYTMPYGQYVYLAELRSNMDVHPTLRMLVHNAQRELNGKRPDIASTVHVNMTPDPGREGFIITRGKQTIVMNGEGIE